VILLDKIIEVFDLHKSYGDVHAVKGISFYVEKGKLFSFLGPNGAGKSTTIDIICTFLKPDKGEIIVDGHKLGEEDDAIRSSIGVVFQQNLLDRLLTVEENLRLRAGLYGLKGKALDDAIKRVSEDIGICDILKRPYGNLSGGQKRKCDIARALVHSPEILFMDEPTTGLDPQARKTIWETILKLQREKSMTVFMTTHYMEEAAQADYVIVINKGTIAAKGTPSELKERYSHDRLSLIGVNNQELMGHLQTDGIAFQQHSDRLVIDIPSTMASIGIIEKYKSSLAGFEVTMGTMDDAFISITGKEMRE